MKKIEIFERAIKEERNQGIYDKQHLFRTHRNTCSF